MIAEFPVLIRVRPTIFCRTGLNILLALLQCSLEFVTCLILGHFRSFFEGAHQFWTSVAKGMGGREAEGGGWGGRWQKLVKKCPE